MIFAAALRTHLANDAGIAAIAEDRIYPGYAPELRDDEKLQPTLIFRLASRRDDLLLDGPMTMATTIWDVILTATEYDQAHALADATIASLNYFKGSMGGINVQSCVLDDAADDDDPYLGSHAVVTRFQIRYQ